MDCEDETVEEHDKYAFFLGSAIRNEDPEQFLTVYDSIIPKTLPETLVESIKERAREIAGLPEKEFHELVLNARDYSLAQDRQLKMTSSASSKEAFFSAVDDDLRYIDDEEETRDDVSTDDSRSPPKSDRPIPQLIGLLKPPDLDDDLEPVGSDSGVFNISKATETASVGSGSEKQDDSDTEIPYCRLNSSSNANPGAAVKDQHWDEAYPADSDSGSQLDLESPRSDTSMSSGADGRLNACEEVEMETFRIDHTRSYGSLDADPTCIHKRLYGSRMSGYDHMTFPVLKKECHTDCDEFDVSELPDAVCDDSKTKYGQRSSLTNIHPVKKVSTNVDDAFRISMFHKVGSQTDSDKSFSYLSSRSSRNSRSLDSSSPLSPFLLNDDDDEKKKKKKKKGSKDDNEIGLFSRKDRSETDVNGNPLALPLDYMSKRELKTKTSSHSDTNAKPNAIDNGHHTSPNNDAEEHGNGNQRTRHSNQKKKCREKEVHPEKEEGYIGDKDIDFILKALKENAKGSKPKKAASGQREGMTLQAVSKVEKAESKNVKNSKSEKKQKQVVHVSECLNMEPSVSEESVTKQVMCEVNNKYSYIRLKNSTVIPNTSTMGTDNGKLNNSDLVQVIVESSNLDSSSLPKGCVAKIIPSAEMKPSTLTDDTFDMFSKSIDTDACKLDSRAVNASSDTAKVSLKVELSSINTNTEKEDRKEMVCPAVSSSVEDEPPKSPEKMGVKDFIDIQKTCDILDPIEARDDLSENGPPDKYSDFYIFTDVEIQKVDRDAEFCPVVHKKKKRTTAKDSTAPIVVHKSGALPLFTPRTTGAVTDSYVNYRDFSQRNDSRKFTRSVTPPPSSQSIENQKLRDLSPSAFPALRRSAASKGKGTVTEGRRNSTGDVSMEVAVSRIHDDSDLESVKSLPAASQTSDTSPGVSRPIISYAKVAASPKPHITSPLSPPSKSDASPARQQTVWKGNVRERRHSLGSSPDCSAEDGKLSDALRQKSGSQTCLAAECACSESVSPGAICKNRESVLSPCDTVSIETAVTSMKSDHLLTGQIATEDQTSAKSPKFGSCESSVPATCSFHVESVISTISSPRQPSRQDSLHPCSAESAKDVSSVDRFGHSAGLLSAPGKPHRGIHSPGDVLKLPPNNGKKFKQSVIFLDKRLAGPPQDLGITFGFEPDLESGQNSGGMEVSVDAVEDGVNDVPMLPEGSVGKNDLAASKADLLTPSTAAHRKPTHPKQTGPSSVALKAVASVQDRVNHSSKPVPSPDAALKGTGTVPSARQMPAAGSPDLTKPSNKGAYPGSTLNGVVMSLVQGDKNSVSVEAGPESILNRDSGSADKLLDSAILYSSENPPLEPSSSCPVPGPPANPHDKSGYQSNNSSSGASISSSSSSSSMVMSGSTSVVPETLLTVVYGKSIPMLCLSTSVASKPPSSRTQTGAEDSLNMTTEMPCEKNGPQKVIRFQMEAGTRGKFNWEEAAKFLTKEWEKILTQKEKSPESVVMYSCNSAC